jgi:hypothetical protein
MATLALVSVFANPRWQNILTVNKNQRGKIIQALMG